MPNGREFLDSLELENSIKSMGDRELMEFTAREAYGACLVGAVNSTRLDKIEKQNKRITAGVGGAGTFIGAIIVAVMNYLRG